MVLVNTRECIAPNLKLFIIKISYEFCMLITGCSHQTWLLAVCSVKGRTVRLELFLWKKKNSNELWGVNGGTAFCTVFDILVELWHVCVNRNTDFLYAASHLLYRKGTSLACSFLRLSTNASSRGLAFVCSMKKIQGHCMEVCRW